MQSGISLPLGLEHPSFSPADGEDRGAATVGAMTSMQCALDHQVELGIS